MIFNCRNTINPITLMLVIFIWASFINCSKSYATRELRETTLDVATRSEEIVVARCVSAESRWNEQGSLIFTYLTFQVEDAVKATNERDSLTLRIFGGRVGDIVQSVPDMPEFSENEEVMLFLGPRNESGYQTLSSIANGVLRIHDDPKTGNKLITVPTRGLQIFKKDTDESLSASDENEVLLGDLIYSLKKAMDK